jgi:hypothetical protein
MVPYEKRIRLSTGILMHCPFLRAAFFVTATLLVSPVYAQFQSPAAPPPPLWPPPQVASGYPFAAPTPADAYRDGLINRWEYERYEPLPEALQGPPANGTRGGDGGGGRD